MNYRRTVPMTVPGTSSIEARPRPRAAFLSVCKVGSYTTGAYVRGDRRGEPPYYTPDYTFFYKHMWRRATGTARPRQNENGDDATDGGRGPKDNVRSAGAVVRTRPAAQEGGNNAHPPHDIAAFCAPTARESGAGIMCRRSLVQV